MDKIRISPTQMRMFSRCDRAWWFDKVMKVPRSNDTPDTILGHLVHDMLEQYHLGNVDEMWSILKMNSEVTADQYDLVVGMMKNYIDNENNMDIKIPKPHEVDEFVTEYKINMHKEKYNAIGCIDILIRNGDEVYVVEHKTATQPYTITDYMMHLQAKMYAYMVFSKWGVYPKILFNILIKAYPKKPSVNKNGSISKRKIRTTPEVYRQTILENNRNVEDYEEILSYLENNSYIFNQRYLIDTEKYMRNWIKTLDKVSSNMVEYNRANEMPPGNPNRTNCRLCPFSNICAEASDNYDEAVGIIRFLREVNMTAKGELINVEGD